MQDLLDRCAAFADFRYNAQKCGSLCMVNQSPRIYVDSLFTPRLGEEEIPALAWEDRYRYLGCPTGAFQTKEQDLNTIRGNLIRDTVTIFKSPLAEWQKLDVFQRFLFPQADLHTPSHLSRVNLVQEAGHHSARSVQTGTQATSQDCHPILLSTPGPWRFGYPQCGGRGPCCPCCSGLQVPWRYQRPSDP